jgi:hypothetical protein
LRQRKETERWRPYIGVAYGRASEEAMAEETGVVVTGVWPARPPAPDSFVEEVKASLASIAPDCPCRERVEEALDRISHMRQRHQRTAALREARESRNSIMRLLELLAELEELTEAEPDLSAFDEAAALFEDIAAAAAAGAHAARRAGSMRATGRIGERFSE